MAFVVNPERLLILWILLSATAGCNGPETTSTDGQGTSSVSDSVGLFAVAPEDDAIVKALADYQVPGLAVAELRNCEPRPTRAFGLADVKTRQPATAMTAFEAASLSKPVFGYLVMSLVEDGIVDLDRSFAPEFIYARVTDQEAFAKLTPRMVLSHKTGLPNWVGNTAYFDRTDPIAFVAEPSEEFTYSGEAYQILKEFIEFRTQQTLGELFVEKLGAVPLGSAFYLVFPKTYAGRPKLAKFRDWLLQAASCPDSNRKAASRTDDE